MPTIGSAQAQVPAPMRPQHKSISPRLDGSVDVAVEAEIKLPKIKLLAWLEIRAIVHSNPSDCLDPLLRAVTAEKKFTKAYTLLQPLFTECSHRTLIKRLTVSSVPVDRGEHHKF